MPKKKEMEELEQDLSSFSSQLRRAFRARFRLRSEVYDSQELGGWMYVEDVFVDHPTLGNSVVVDKNGTLWQVAYTGEGPEVSFDPPANWVAVYRTYVPVPTSASATEVAEVADDGETAEFGEAAGGAILGLVEGDTGSGPLQLNIAVIEPGWGNKRDNYFYPGDVLVRDAKVFEGAKMYATNHKLAEKSVLTEVSQVLECPTGFTESGAPIARVGVFSEAFAESIRNRDSLGVLGDLHCSILAGGKAQKGFEADGRKGRKVVAITEARSVDWVTSHGAGGRALSLAESDSTFMEAQMNEHDDVVDTEAEATAPAQEADVEEAAFVEEKTPAATDEGDNESTEEAPPATPAVAEESEPEEEPEVFLAEADAKAIFAEVKNLPDATRERLEAGQYHNRYEALAALEAEQTYLRTITNSGKPPTFGEEAGEQPATLSEKDVREKQAEINAQFLPNVR